MTRLVALVLLLGGAARADDAGVFDQPRALAVKHGLLELDDGHTAFVDGGVWLREDVAMLRAKDLARLEAENRALREAPTATPTAVAVGVLLGIVVGLGAGAYVTVKACGATAICR